MPLYSQGSASLPLTALWPGDTVKLFDAESPLTGQKSIAVCLTPGRFGELQSFSVEIAFSGAPGAFNYQIETADSDLDANYVTEPTNGTITAVGTPSVSVARAEFTAIRAKFVRILVNTQAANAVTVTAKISR